MICHEKLLSKNENMSHYESLVSTIPVIEQRGALRSKANTTHSKILATPAGILLLRSFCPSSLIELLHADSGLCAFARLPEREHALLASLAQRPDSALTIAYTPTGEIVGQVTLAPADGSWAGAEHVYEIAIEVSSNWRRLGLARYLLDTALALDNLDELVILAIGLSWHWDTKGLGLSPFQYRQLIAQLLTAHGFAEYTTTEENITADPANILLARIGCQARTETVNHFFSCMLRMDDLSGLL